MKKFLVLSFIALFVFAFGVAYAAEKEPVLEFKGSGFVDAVATTYRNVAGSSGALYGPPGADNRPNGGAYDEGNAWVNSRARLKFDAVLGKQATGTIFFEMDSTRWGERSGDAGRNRAGVIAADQAAVEVKQYYINFGVPTIPIPTNVVVGVQGFYLRPQMLLNTDLPGVTIGIKPIDPLTFTLIWAKYLEGMDAAADDADLYGLHAAFKVQTLTVGGYALYYNMNTYRTDQGIVAYGGTIPYYADMWYFGGYADGKVGPILLNFDFIVNDGEVEARKNFAIPAGAKRKVDYSGWVASIKAAFPWEKFEFGGKFLYASGNDLKKTSNTGLPGSADGYDGTRFTRKVSGYVIPVGSEAFGGFSEDIVFYGTWIDRGGFGNGISSSYTAFNRGAFGGTWFAKLYGKFAVAPDFKVTAQALYIGDTTKNGNTIGNAVKANGRPRDDSFIGIEADLITELMIYKNLKWSTGFGWLFAGDGLEMRVGATNTNDEMKDPWRLVTQLIYTF